MPDVQFVCMTNMYTVLFGLILGLLMHLVWSNNSVKVLLVNFKFIQDHSISYIWCFNISGVKAKCSVEFEISQPQDERKTIWTENLTADYKLTKKYLHLIKISTC